MLCEKQMKNSETSICLVYRLNILQLFFAIHKCLSTRSTSYRRRQPTNGDLQQRGLVGTGSYVRSMPAHGRITARLCL